MMGLGQIKLCVYFGLAVLGVNFLLTSCKGSDQETREKIFGVWELGKYHTTTFETNGVFETKLTTLKSTNCMKWSGTWTVENMALVLKTTNRIPDVRGTTSFNPNDISRSPIVEVDASNLILIQYGRTNSFKRK